MGSARGARQTRGVAGTQEQDLAEPISTCPTPQASHTDTDPHGRTESAHERKS